MTLDFKRCRNVEQLQKVLNSLYRLYYTCVNIRRIPYFLKTLLYPISLPPSGLSRLHDRILGIWKEREKRFRVSVRTRSTIGEIEPERRRMKCRKTFSSSFFLSKSFAQSTKPISSAVNRVSLSLSGCPIMSRLRTCRVDREFWLSADAHTRTHTHARTRTHSVAYIWKCLRFAYFAPSIQYLEPSFLYSKKCISFLWNSIDIL